MAQQQEDLPRGVAEERMAARTQAAISFLVGVVVAVVVLLIAPPEFAALAGWDTAAIVYMVWVWTTIWPCDAERTAQLANYADPTRATADLMLLGASLASLVAVGYVLAAAAESSGAGQLVRVAIGLASVVLSWAMVHTVFTLNYARLYYRGPDGGVDFNQREPPRYSDFAYLAFTIGMTFQVSDTTLQDVAFRRLALRHALLAFLFGTGILATTINLVASLSSQ